MSKAFDAWGGKEQYLAWRNSYVQTAREWSNGDISLFLENRLNFQRGKRDSLEYEDFSPWENPEDAVMGTLIDVISEEMEMWTENEHIQINNAACAFISTTYDKLVEAHPLFWNDPDLPTIDHYFGSRYVITLTDEEVKIFHRMAHRAGVQINPSEKVFAKPLQDK